jgi:RimJ/RimL family protein N-acetyltransferase
MELKMRTGKEDRADKIFADPDCQVLLHMPDHYARVGYNPPWVGYFILNDGQAVGCCGFTGSPKEGKVEIAYWTFKGNEGRGVASFACKQLIQIAKLTDPAVIITAKTLAEKNASTTILEKNGFMFSGIVQDEDEGDVWGWTLQ